MSAAALLPANASIYEVALAEGMSELPPALIREAMDPATTPLSVLPFLAVHRHVRLWYPDWSEARRRQMAQEGPELAGLVGTQAAAARFLAFVDAEIIGKVSYPSRFVQSRAVLGRTPIGHPPFLARYLVKVETFTPPRAFVLGRSILGPARLKRPTREPFNRALAALRVAKAPETEYRVDFAHLRPLSIADAPPLDGTYALDAYVSRTWL